MGGLGPLVNSGQLATGDLILFQISLTTLPVTSLPWQLFAIFRLN